MVYIIEQNINWLYDYSMLLMVLISGMFRRLEFKFELDCNWNNNWYGDTNIFTLATLHKTCRSWNYEQNNNNNKNGIYDNKSVI